MERLEKVRTFLYDLDKIRSDTDAVYNLIMEYLGISENKTSADSESGGIDVMVEIGDLDGDDLEIHITVDGERDGLWFTISNADDDDFERLERKEGDIILDTKI